MVEDIESVLALETRLDEHQQKKNKIVQERDIDGFFHPSAIGNCTKKLWYAFASHEPRHNIPTKLRYTFGHGHAVHDWMQREFEDILCGLVDDDWTFTFDAEISIRDPLYANSFAEDMHLAGRTDGLITCTHQDGRVYRVIYELKTASDSSFSRISKPQEAHVRQASIYAHCFDADVIVFQYYNKNSDISKFFYVPKNETALNDVKEQLGKVLDHMSAGTTPDTTSNRWECRTCPYYHDCRPET